MRGLSTRLPRRHRFLLQQTARLVVKVVDEIQQILHHFDQDTSEKILKKVARALDPGGRIAIQEYIVDDDRLRRRKQLGFTMTLLAISKVGEAYSFGDIRRLLVRNKFRQVQFHSLGQPAQIVTAIK